jgi:hypothetical protein
MNGVLMVRVVILGCSGAAGSGRHFDVRNDSPLEETLEPELEVVGCEPTVDAR